MPVRIIDNDFLVLPITVNPALDRRFPMLNGGGRTPTGDYMGVTYRSPWCRHGWRAQQRPSSQGSSNKVYFGCRGYVKDHELSDDYDCGYVEEGVFNLGVASIQVPNPAWGGDFIASKTETGWIQRAKKLNAEPKTSWPEPDEEIGLVAPTAPGSPNKVYYAGRLGSQPSSPSKTSSSTLSSSQSKSNSLPLYRAAPLSPPKAGPSASPTTPTRVRPSASDMSLGG